MNVLFKETFLGKNVFMKRIIKTLIIIILIAAVAAGILFVVRTILPGRWKSDGSTDIEPVQADITDDELKEYVCVILNAIKERDYGAVASVVHPEYGVIFSPYATVSLSTDRCFTNGQVSGFAEDTKKYIWGVYDGSGEPIEMTPAEYFDQFVFDVDFTKCVNFGIDEILRTGNSLENVEEVFSNARYVDCYMPDPKGESEPDWNSLRLVFEEYDGCLMLTAVIHNEYTI